MKPLSSLNTSRGRYQPKGGECPSPETSLALRLSFFKLFSEPFHWHWLVPFWAHSPQTKLSWWERKWQPVFPDSIFPTFAEAVDLLEQLVGLVEDGRNVSMSKEGAGCFALQVGQYATLHLPLRQVFGDRYTSHWVLTAPCARVSMMAWSVICVLSHDWS